MYTFECQVRADLDSTNDLERRKCNQDPSHKDMLQVMFGYGLPLTCKKYHCVLH